MTCVDVVVVVHNHASTLAATLAGLASQTLAPCRVVVVDNASSDGSRALLASSRLAGLDVVAWDVNRGFAAAVNEGLRRGQSPWALSLTPTVASPLTSWRPSSPRPHARAPGGGVRSAAARGG